MTKDAFIEKHKLVDGCIILEPWEIFSKGIIKVTGHRHIVYDYELLADALAEDYRAGGEPEDPEYDFLMQAIDWIEYNTIRTIEYLPKTTRPYISLNGEIVAGR